MWLIIFGITLAAFIAGVIYLIVAIGRFGGVKKISREKKPVNVIISILIIALLFAVFTIAFDMLNAVVILLLVMLFFLIYGLVLKLIKHILKWNPKFYLQGWLAILSSIIYLVPGYYLCHHVWQKDYIIQTEKNVESIKVAMFADSHIGTTFDGDGFAKHMQEIQKQNPDILLIVGDFVDDSSKREDMLRACEALGEMNLKYGVYFTFGNHDEGYYDYRDFSGDDLRKALTENGVHVLEDEYELVDDRFYIAGRAYSHEGDRKDINTLISGADKDKYIIVMDHVPDDYENESSSEADLVLSGHTHGGQMIPITYVGEWFGINDRTYGYEHRNGTDFIVTSGISDWEIKFKTGTKSEYVIINIE